MIVLMNMGAMKKLELYYKSSREINETIARYEGHKIFGQGENAFFRYKAAIKD